VERLLKHDMLQKHSDAKLAVTEKTLLLAKYV